MAQIVVFLSLSNILVNNNKSDKALRQTDKASLYLKNKKHKTTTHTTVYQTIASNKDIDIAGFSTLSAFNYWGIRKDNSTCRTNFKRSLCLFHFF